MIRGILGKKIGMTQIFDNDGNVIPVTAVEAGPCYVLETKQAPLKVTLGFEKRSEKNFNNPQKGYFKKLGLAPLKFIKEFTSTDNKDYKIGQEIKADFFKAGEYVSVSGITIGKGFAGGVKRWNWKGGNQTHGSMTHRRPGSIGSSSDPSRVWKGHHMPGHMGSARVTVENLRVMQVDLENNLLLIKGAVPGHKNSYIEINKSLKKAYRALDEQKVVVKAKRDPMKQAKASTKGKG